MVANPNILPGLRKGLSPRHHSLPLHRPPPCSHMCTHTPALRGYEGPCRILCSMIPCHIHMAQSPSKVLVTETGAFLIYKMAISCFNLIVSFATVVRGAHSGTHGPGSAPLCDSRQDPHFPALPCKRGEQRILPREVGSWEG